MVVKQEWFGSLEYLKMSEDIWKVVFYDKWIAIGIQEEEAEMDWTASSVLRVLPKGGLSGSKGQPEFTQGVWFLVLLLLHSWL